ncbi:hypothetical protein [Actinoplanes sp. HUAS TT8]|uniref:hypothetical protein n=1 Tax=Actinoplanes sp. HUAS TT8 TaxID=3447453 RepID=UPI003F527986
MTASHLVFDATCLSYFARADRLDVLGDLLAGVRTSVPHVVREEIRAGIPDHPALAHVLDVEWLSVAALDTLDRIRRFAVWSARVGAGARDLGEASVLAVAEEYRAVALIDDRDATRTGRAFGVEVHGTLWLLGAACAEGKLTEVGAGNIVDALAALGMRLPCSGEAFPRFARRHGLL